MKTRRKEMFTPQEDEIIADSIRRHGFHYVAEACAAIRSRLGKERTPQSVAGRAYLLRIYGLAALTGFTKQENCIINEERAKAARWTLAAQRRIRAELGIERTRGQLSSHAQHIPRPQKFPIQRP